jgi:tRNA-modifying protein YgfZ
MGGTPESPQTAEKAGAEAYNERLIITETTRLPFSGSHPWNEILAGTPVRFDPATGNVGFADPREEIRFAQTGCAAVPLTHLGTLHASGDDAATLLHNLLSNDVKKLGSESVQHNSFNTPKGRMLASMQIWRAQDGYRISLSADIAAAMQKKLSMYVLRAKARIVDTSSQRGLIGLCGNVDAALGVAGLSVPTQAMTVATQADSTIAVVRLDARRCIVDAPVEAIAALWSSLVSQGALPAGTETWRWFEIEAGIPLITAASQDEFVAQMLNFELLGGVDFKKGCYPGQEIVARTQYLGKLKKRMFRAHVDTPEAPTANTDLYSTAFGEQSCGKVVSVAPSLEQGFDLLAVMQIAAQESQDVHLGAPDGATLSFSELPYTVD